ncbi:uncharacterized protein DUF3570 [Panacagrimonas perspica]|uniref:Uncharacterized protein DUF3570 n=1 Tax=Panacagrimonas perspica TaxID=381431 RepID=A0A4R7PF90_9GAMM|nr:DUF3570 domain-containing protein [Panacagrimonas perspica]TDU32020.1 uncharacterized protein DUF3570 [Panacagrimonas perspica]
MQLIASGFWHKLRDRLAIGIPALLALLPGQRAAAAVLPEERADTLYHLYDGGGQTVQGPALLVRKNFAERVSVTGGYYVDRISGASIDVVTNASKYTEERTEYSAGAELLHHDTSLSVSYTDSDENDYQARTLRLGVSQDLFQSRTTVALGYSSGRDDVGRVHTPFSEKANRDVYSLSVTQVINPTFLGNFAYEITADDGYLQNPYRSARVQGGTVPEIYPGTRTGHALSARLVKSWSESWSSRLEGRYYHDTWEVDAFNIGVGATHRLPRGWIVDASYRFYVQGAASFYSDDFDQPMNFMARDKELASFTGHTLGAKLTLPLARWESGHVLNGIDLSTAGYLMRLQYSDFTDVRDGGDYSFNAVIAQAFLTIRY